MRMRDAGSVNAGSVVALDLVFINENSTLTDHSTLYFIPLKQVFLCMCDRSESSVFRLFLL